MDSKIHVSIYYFSLFATRIKYRSRCTLYSIIELKSSFCRRRRIASDSSSSSDISESDIDEVEVEHNFLGGFCYIWCESSLLLVL